MKIIIFDDDCLVCSRFIKVVNKFDKKKSLHFSYIGSKYFNELVEKGEIDHEVESIVFCSENKIYYKSDALIEIMKCITGYASILNFLYIFPKKIRDYFYTLFASNRHRFGEKTSCEYDISLVKRIIK